MKSSSTPQRRRLRVVGAALLESDKVLIVRRPQGDVGAGAWEFPGGKIEVGESPKQALHREVEEELGIQVEILADLGWIEHAYDNVDIELNVFVCRRTLGDIVLAEHDAQNWVKPSELKMDELLAADRPFVQKIVDWIGSRK